MCYHEVGKNMTMREKDAKVCVAVECNSPNSAPHLVNAEFLVIFYQRRYSQSNLFLLVHPRLM